MRHRHHRQFLSRPNGERAQLLRNLASCLITHGRIRTTEAKAKAIRPYVERLVTLGKKGTVHHRRLAFARLQDKVATHKLFEEIAPAHKDRNGGYLRVILDGQRRVDGSWMAYVEFVDHAEAVAANASTDGAGRASEDA